MKNVFVFILWGSIFLLVLKNMVIEFDICLINIQRWQKNEMQYLIQNMDYFVLSNMFQKSILL